MRPLYDDGASDAKAVTRDYVLELDDHGPPLLSVFGGKITTARHLAEEALGRLGHTSQATRDAKFPGAPDDFAAFLADVRVRWPWLGGARSLRMARAYGTTLVDLIGDGDMGEDFGGGLTAREVDWLIAHEWARTADDVLWRRTKLGLHLDADARARVAAHVEAQIATRSTGPTTNT